MKSYIVERVQVLAKAEGISFGHSMLRYGSVIADEYDFVKSCNTQQMIKEIPNDKEDKGNNLQ